MSDDEQPSRNYDEAFDSAAIQNMGLMVDSMRDGRLDVTRDGHTIEIGERLGEGGSKTVYRAVIDGGTVALALPNVTDNEQVVARKWAVVLNEPDGTDKVRALGIPTNPVCKIAPVEVNSVPFRALMMRQYEDTGFEVRDGKNKRSSVIRSELLPEAFDSDTAEEILSGVLDDIATLVSHGVYVGRDSFNICKDDERVRLYLNDLGSASFGGISREDESGYIESYVGNALDALMNSLTDNEWATHKDFLSSEAWSPIRRGAIFEALVRTVHTRIGSRP